MRELDELVDMKNWDITTEYGPHDYSGTVYSWCGYNSPMSLAEDVIIEFEKVVLALETAVMVLCETHGHAGKRPCQFCRDMMIPK